MKKTTWKKIMSLVLVAALVIGCLQLNAKKVSADSAATVSEVGVVTNTTDPGNPTVTYDLTASNGSSSVFQGTYTDIVLAIDLSNSMKAENGKNPLQDAKDAAKAFVAKLLGAEAATKDYVKIAVVTYGTKATTVCPLTNDVAELNKKINGISINSNNGGTNYDDGIDEAQSALAGSQNAKVLVFMSDGEPTYANGSYEYLGYSWSFDKRPDAVKSLTADDHIKRTSSTDDYFVKNGVLYLWNSQGYWYKANLSDSSNDVVGLGNESCSVIADAATAEAAEAKNAGFTIYTILFNSSSTTATTVLDAIATSGKASTTKDALSEVYDEIGDTITNTIIAGSDAYILAELSEYVKYNPPVEGIDGITTETKDGKTYLTWTIGESLAGDHTSPAIPFAVDKQKVIDAYKANPNAFKVENGKIVVPVTTTATLVYSKGEETITNPVTTSATVQLDVNDFIDYTINYIADGQTVKTDNGTVYTGTKITPVKYTMTELGLTDGYYDDYTVSETEINANNKVINININHKVATVSFYEISDNGFDAEGKDDVTKFIVSKEVKFGDQITADIIENGDKVAIVARDYSKEVTPEVASEAAITYTWTWTGKWDGLGVAEADEISVLALYNDSNAAGNLYTVTFKNGDSTVYTVKQRPGTTFNAPAATEKAPDKQYTYTFANWKLVDGEETLEAGAQEVEVTGDKTYVADYTTEDVLYNVRFVNDADADLINAFTVKYEEVIAADKLQA
ncbi:MAG: VWA domain-containing protein, partial [Lachnospiraceae bacterium]|nr:VWA domain-containing protein [Lachnospiraceae bacterium]